MGGTRAGGLKAAAKNKDNNPNFYADIGRLGGSKSNNGGFASDKPGRDGLTGPQRASKYGYIGGVASRRKAKQRKENE